MCSRRVKFGGIPVVETYSVPLDKVSSALLKALFTTFQIMNVTVKRLLRLVTTPLFHMAVV